MRTNKGRNSGITTPIRGQLLRQLRLDREWTIEDLARASNLTWTTVYRAESGRVSPTETTLIAMSSALGIGVDVLRTTGEGTI